MGKKIISVCLILLYSISTIGVAIYDCRCEHSNTLVMLSADDCSCNHSDSCEHCIIYHSSCEHSGNHCDNSHNSCSDHTDHVSSDEHSCKVIYKSLSSYAEVEIQISSNVTGLSLAVLFPTVIAESPLINYAEEIIFLTEKASKTPLIYRNCQLRL